MGLFIGLAPFDQVLGQLEGGFRLEGCNRRAPIHIDRRFTGLRKRIIDRIMGAIESITPEFCLFSVNDRSGSANYELTILRSLVA